VNGFWEMASRCGVKAVRHANDNYHAIEVTDSKRTFYIVRGKTLVEKV
jgi:hypothetical protein